MALYLPNFRQGDTYRIKLTYPVGTDLTGYIHWLTLEDEVGSNTPVLQVQSTFGSHTGDAANICYLEASATQTDPVASGKYVYAVKAKAPSGDEFTIVPPPDEYRDRIFVAPKVTVES